MSVSRSYFLRPHVHLFFRPHDLSDGISKVGINKSLGSRLAHSPCDILPLPGIQQTSTPSFLPRNENTGLLELTDSNFRCIIS